MQVNWINALNRVADTNPVVFGPLAMTFASVAMTGMGTIVSAMGAKNAAEGQMAAAQATAQAQEFEAKQLDAKGNEERAAAQRQAFEERRRARLVQSKLIANAAASGGSVSDPTVVALGQDIAEEGEMRALTEMYKGENAWRGYSDAAMGRRMTAQASLDSIPSIQSAGRSQAFGTLLNGAGSMFSKFGDYQQSQDLRSRLSTATPYGYSPTPA